VIKSNPETISPPGSLHLPLFYGTFNNHACYSLIVHRLKVVKGMPHSVRVLLITILLVVLQTTLAPFVSVANIIPDILLIWVVYTALQQGQIPATVLGFCAGLVVDLLSGQFLGISALCKTVVGFSAGYFYNENKVNFTIARYQFIVIVGLMSVVHNVIYFTIFVQGTDIGLIGAMARFGLFATIYTTAAALLPWFVFTRKYSV
jgi:rod shape-determining protein MreD